MPITHLEIKDRSNGCGENYEILVVSEVCKFYAYQISDLSDNNILQAFQKKTTLARHRLINELLKNEIAQMHAFSQTTLTPEQYESRLSNSAA
ncbi:bola-like protein [Sanghuangporus baumii]|uniref:Bola-like protein n=1 Tax=Sanghuangporus baumii TaxID=108892 RepID=A0A9Q5NAD0_SANBA|nr:bola-like protein [Sanghuangporus baumii]